MQVVTDIILRPTMTKNRVLPETLPIVYIISIVTLNTVHCQFSGSQFDTSRTRYREEIPGTYRHSQLWRDEPSFSRSSYNNRAPVSSYENFNNPSGYRSRQNTEERGAFSDVFYDNQGRGMAERNVQPPVSLARDNRFLDRAGYSSINNRDGRRSYDQSYNNVPANMQHERDQYSSRGHFVTSDNYQGNNVQTIPYSREVTLNGRSTYASQRGRFLPEQTYQTSAENQFSGRYPLSTNGHSNYSPVSTNGENLIQYRVSASRTAPLPRIPAERNEVFQFRTSVMRTPQSVSSGARQYANRERFTGNPVQSLSLPFEPLSLRYQGFRDSKIAGLERTINDRTTNVNERNSDWNFDTGSRQTGKQFGRNSIMERNDRGTNTVKRNMNDVSRTFQPVKGTVRGQRMSDRATSFVGRNTGRSGNIETVQSDIPFRIMVPGRRMPTRTNNIVDRNTAGIGNTKTIHSGVQSGRTFDINTQYNARHADKGRFNRNIRPNAGYQSVLGPSIPSVNDASFRNPQQLSNRKGPSSTNIYISRNVPNKPGPFHEILGISKAGLENALNTDVPKVERPKQEKNTYPKSKTPKVVVSNRRPRQNRRIQNAENERKTNTDEQIENKANLIDEIRKSMDIADSLDLFRKSQLSIDLEDTEDNDFISRKRFNIIPYRQSGDITQSANLISPRSIHRGVDFKVDDFEDGYIVSAHRNPRHNFIESDEEY